LFPLVEGHRQYVSDELPFYYADVMDKSLFKFGICPCDQDLCDEWEHLFYVCLEFRKNVLCISRIQVPVRLRKQGIATELFRLISEMCRNVEMHDTVAMVDVSPDYNDYWGVSTHLAGKFGINVADPQTDEELFKLI
jgi:hypothetical protein